MIDIIRSEWIKFRSVRSNLVLISTAALLVIVIDFFVIRQLNHDAVGSIGIQRHLSDVTGPLPLALFLFGALGVQIIGQEYRFSTIRPTFTAVPTRWKVLVGKLVVLTVAIAVVSAVMLAICTLMGSTMLHHFSIDGVDHRVMWGVVLFAVGWSALAMGVGAILRQPIAGMLVLLIEAFVVENLIGHIIKGTAQWLPFQNGIQMTFREDGHRDLALRSVTAGGVYFFIVAAVIWGLGAYLASRRDA